MPLAARSPLTLLSIYLYTEIFFFVFGGPTAIEDNNSTQKAEEEESIAQDSAAVARGE